MTRENRSGNQPARPSRRAPKNEVFGMTEKKTDIIEELAEDAEITLSTDYDKRDLKERRGVIKDNLYDGSKKLKHSVPKGKRV